MQQLILNILVFIFTTNVFAQKIEFKVELSSDTILLGNYLEIKYTILNGDGKFIPPSFQGLKIKAGPNQASSYSVINGEVSQSTSYTYYLEPELEGNYIIDAAELKTKDEKLLSPELKIVVMPNPDGIKQSPGNFDSELIFPSKNEKKNNSKKSRPSYKI